MEFKILNRTRNYSGFFSIEKIVLSHELFSGSLSPPITRELIVKGHAAAVLLYDPVLRNLVLVEQFRVGAMAEAPWLIELVAGYIEAGEDAVDVIQREAHEEAACEIADAFLIQRFYVSPGSTEETMSLFCARVDSSKAGGIYGLAEEGEDIRVLVVPVDEAYCWLDQGQMSSATPTIALQWLKLNETTLRERWKIDESTG